MDRKFKELFYDICHTEEVFLITGNTRKEAKLQLGEDILNKAQAVFTCAGNECWVQDLLVYRRLWKPDENLVSYLESLVDETWFEHTTGDHVEHRTGMIKFSILGKNYSKKQREDYISWDRRKSERKNLVEKINQKFKVDAFIAGETSIDIFEKGYGKSQIYQQIKTSAEDYLVYYGDQIFPNGNDWDIARLCDTYWRVENWKDTFKLLG